MKLWQFVAVVTVGAAMLWLLVFAVSLAIMDESVLRWVAIANLAATGVNFLFAMIYLFRRV